MFHGVYQSMLKKLLLFTSAFLSFAFVFLVSLNNQTEQMPLIKDDPYFNATYGETPIEQRGAGVRKWLATGLKISVSGASGSGTIVYYDELSKYAYVQSCGHLWNGSMTAQEGIERKVNCKVITWYHNDQKLPSPKTYTAEVLYYNNGEGEDCSLLRFKPDWTPDYFPIAPEDFIIQPNTKFHSVGCDSGGEVAHYDVTSVGLRKIGPNQSLDLVTTQNSPRPGRSGGGLMTDEFYIAICWGTSDYEGRQNGFFTPHQVFRAYNKKNGYEWLNQIGTSLARQIPIIDRNNPQGKYPKNYVPLPNR
jgi:hypothetical protein